MATLLFTVAIKQLLIDLFFYIDLVAVVDIIVIIAMTWNY